MSKSAKNHVFSTKFCFLKIFLDYILEKNDTLAYCTIQDEHLETKTTVKNAESKKLWTFSVYATKKKLPWSPLMVKNGLKKIDFLILCRKRSGYNYRMNAAKISTKNAF